MLTDILSFLAPSPSLFSLSGFSRCPSNRWTTAWFVGSEKEKVVNINDSDINNS